MTLFVQKRAVFSTLHCSLLNIFFLKFELFNPKGKHLSALNWIILQKSGKSFLPQRCGWLSHLHKTHVLCFRSKGTPSDWHIAPKLLIALYDVLYYTERGPYNASYIQIKQQEPLNVTTYPLSWDWHNYFIAPPEGLIHTILRSGKTKCTDGAIQHFFYGCQGKHDIFVYVITHQRRHCCCLQAKQPFWWDSSRVYVWCNYLLLIRP